VSEPPRVSVVMPLYNAEAFVESALRSALASDLAALEVLVADDGSTDRSAAIVAAIRDPRVTLERLAPSGGPSRPRNAGIAQARAPYVAFLDSDDLVRPYKLSAAVLALDDHPQAGFAFADFESIDEGGRVLEASILRNYPVLQSLQGEPLGEDWRLIGQRELARGLLHENFIGTSGVVVRRGLLDELGGFDESLVYSEDRDLWFRLAHRCGALFWNRVGHSYRTRPGNLSTGSQLRNARARITVLRRERGRWGERGARRQLDRLIAENYGVIGHEERRHHRLRALSCYARAFTISPQLRWLRGLLGSVVR
jgi:glycosyltransferase involved in cell wall biosynthesis